MDRKLVTNNSPRVLSTACPFLAAFYQPQRGTETLNLYLPFQAAYVFLPLTLLLASLWYQLNTKLTVGFCPVCLFGYSLY